MATGNVRFEFNLSLRQLCRYGQIQMATGHSQERDGRARQSRELPIRALESNINRGVAVT
jgi:hypothetical protein